MQTVSRSTARPAASQLASSLQHAATRRSVIASSSSLQQQNRHRSGVAGPSYAGHVSINGFQRGLLAVGSAVTSLLNPYRHDMVAVLGETTSNRQLPKMRDALLKGGEEGRQILRDRPRLTTETINLEELRALPEGSFGRAYVAWLEKCGVSPDTREPVSLCDLPATHLANRASRNDRSDTSTTPSSHTSCSAIVNVTISITSSLASQSRSPLSSW